MTEPDYSLDNLPERARLAREALADYTRCALSNYARRREDLRQRKLPVVSFVGYGRAGKDTAAKIYCQLMQITYGGSTSLAVLPYVAHATGDREWECYSKRHANREFWFRFCNELRRGEPDLLAKLVLSQGDVLVGVRAAEEFRCLIPGGVADINVWIDRRDTPVDSTVEFTRDEADLVIDNNGSINELREKLNRLVKLILVNQ